MITDSKKHKLVLMIFSLTCITAIGICLICDYAINRAVTWSAYVISSVIYAWIIATPLIIIKKRRMILTASAFIIAAFPYLYILNRITPVKGWFSALALPICITVIIAVGIILALHRFLKINKWYFYSIVVFIIGIAVNSAIEFFVCNFTGNELLRLNYFVNLLVCFIIVALLAVLGYHDGTSKVINVSDNQDINNQDVNKLKK